MPPPPNGSCLTNLLEALSDWIDACGEGKSVDINLTMQKLLTLLLTKDSPISWTIMIWDVSILLCIESFLSGRRQQVLLRNGVSGWKPVSNSVLQGSILGPILFLLFAEVGRKYTILIFADDSNVNGQAISKED